MMASSSFEVEEEEKKNIERKKTIEKKNNVEKGGSLLFSSCFYIWDETLLLPSPLHLPQALCLTSPRNFVLFKLRSSPKLWRWSEWEMR